MFAFAWASVSSPVKWDPWDLVMGGQGPGYGEAPHGAPGPRSAWGGSGHSPPPQEPGMSPPEGKTFVGLIYYCLTSSDTDIPPPGLWTPGPGESDLSNKIQYEEWTATHMHPQLKLQ